MNNPESMTQVLGLDSNSLHLHAIAQNNLTVIFVATKKKKIIDLIHVQNLVFKHING